MNRVTRAIALALLWSTAAVVPTSAAVTLYSDRAAFEAAIGPHDTNSFDVALGFPQAPARISAVGPAIVSSGSPGNPAYLRPYPDKSDNQTLSGEYGSVITQPLDVSFQSPQFALGFDMYTAGHDGLFVVRFANGTFDQFGVQALGDRDFFGIVSDAAIAGVTVRNTGDSRSQQYKGIDNFTVVPEPTVLGPLTALCLLLRLRRGASSLPNHCRLRAAHPAIRTK